MRQTTLATAGFERFGKPTRRATFLAEMEHVVPWRELCALIEPFYPKAGKGRTPVGLGRMLRISAAMVQLVGPSSGRGDV